MEKFCGRFLFIFGQKKSVFFLIMKRVNYIYLATLLYLLLSVSAFSQNYSKIEEVLYYNISNSGEKQLESSVLKYFNQSDELVKEEECNQNGDVICTTTFYKTYNHHIKNMDFRVLNTIHPELFDDFDYVLVEEVQCSYHESIQSIKMYSKQNLLIKEFLLGMDLETTPLSKTEYEYSSGELHTKKEYHFDLNKGYILNKCTKFTSCQ